MNADPVTCASAVSAACDQADVRLVVVGSRTTSTPMCRACRASAERLGLPFRPYAQRDIARERRRNRFVMAGESLGRRVTDALVYARRAPMA